MSDDRDQSEPHPVQRNRQVGENSGCLSAFMVLWGIAFCLVGVLIAGVSGFCGFWVLKDGSPVQDLGGTFAAGFGIGIFLCIAGYLMMRGRNL